MEPNTSVLFDHKYSSRSNGGSSPTSVTETGDLRNRANMLQGKPLDSRIMGLSIENFIAYFIDQKHSSNTQRYSMQYLKDMWNTTAFLHYNNPDINIGLIKKLAIEAMKHSAPDTCFGEHDMAPRYYSSKDISTIRYTPTFVLEYYISFKKRKSKELLPHIKQLTLNLIDCKNIAGDGTSLFFSVPGTDPEERRNIKSLYEYYQANHTYFLTHRLTIHTQSTEINIENILKKHEKLISGTFNGSEEAIIKDMLLLSRRISLLHPLGDGNGRIFGMILLYFLCHKYSITPPLFENDPKYVTTVSLDVAYILFKEGQDNTLRWDTKDPQEKNRLYTHKIPVKDLNKKNIILFSSADLAQEKKTHTQKNPKTQARPRNRKKKKKTLPNYMKPTASSSTDRLISQTNRSMWRHRKRLTTRISTTIKSLK